MTMRRQTVDPQDADVSIAHPRAASRCPRGSSSAPTDGNRLCREAAGIDVRRRDLNQAALTFNITHSRPHKNISTEFHTPQGPCVFVPLPGNRCSVVWVVAPERGRAADGA